MSSDGAPWNNRRLTVDEQSKLRAPATVEACRTDYVVGAFERMTFNERFGPKDDSEAQE
jgi:hypothetical protein